MKIVIPTHPSQITLANFISYKKAADDIERLMIATGRSRKAVMAFNSDTANYVISTYEAVMDKTDGELKRHIKLRRGFRSVKLSFIPALENMTLAEHVDLDDLSSAIWKDERIDYLVKFFAILYRPVSKKLGKWYALDKYDSEKNAHESFIETIDMNTVNSALLFFSTIGNELRQNSLAYLEAMAMKAAKKK